MNSIGQLQFINGDRSHGPYLSQIKSALDAGCTWIQLRIKDLPITEIETIAHAAKSLCTAKQATFIINDHVAVALNCKADGVHLGKSDTEISEARETLGNDFIIGGTANTAADVQHLIKSGVDYIGLGPFQFTTTKKVLSPSLGLTGYQQIIEAVPNGTPIVAIGGITVNDVKALRSTGLHGIAISGALLNNNFNNLAQFQAALAQ